MEASPKSQVLSVHLRCKLSQGQGPEDPPCSREWPDPAGCRDGSWPWKPWEGRREKGSLPAGQHGPTRPTQRRGRTKGAVNASGLSKINCKHAPLSSGPGETLRLFASARPAALSRSQAFPRSWQGPRGMCPASLSQFKASQTFLVLAAIPLPAYNAPLLPARCRAVFWDSGTACPSLLDCSQG